ncbi:DNA-dependent protein kinase catalytic subunit [Acipenser oxyrinchus oxyrinchus]|uniref:DNA-dependent protein kinase catalytic subunit n=1 Tax=Acipenser oxyrinchus oxyrinchus TaxID=40147 RepID=A0AAD8GGM0_ACIOX|nr:DNA-dependent protein kinase catalytic subunit [Acipenser oxyrinchus oxyrinchus]
MAQVSSCSAGAGGIQGNLHKLHSFLNATDTKSAAVESHNLIGNLGQECMVSKNENELVLQTSLIFSKEDGLLAFVRKSLNIEDFRDTREEVLKLLTTFLDRIAHKVNGWEKNYASHIKDTCLVVYTKDRAAKCKVSALELLIKLLRITSPCLLQEFKVGDLFNKFYGDLAQKSKIPDTVLEKIYELLGVLGEVQPSDMLNNSEKLYRAYLSELKSQMTSATREPKLPVVAGCLKGLTALMINFTKSMDEDPKSSKEIFDFALKAISPQTEFKRYAVLLAGLRLFAKHAGQFSSCLMDNYRSLYEVMSKWCGHTNIEMKKAGYHALEAFLKQVALLVAENAELHKSKLEFFMRQFYTVIRTLDSSTKELSIAIRGYGLFAAPCKAVCPGDVDFMYTELIQRCKQMYLTETDTEDDNVYQLPSFLDSIASVIFHLDRIPEVYTPVLERLLVVQIDSFPQYSPRMQPVCCRSIVKVFIALAGKGPVLWSFISTVVHQGLIRVCSKPVLLTGEEGGQEGGQPVEKGQVHTGKWKVPTYRDYLDLFRSLLDCDKMKDTGFVDGAFDVRSSSLHSLNRLLYDELIKSILKIIEKLDLSVQKQSADEQEGRSDASSSMLIPSSDPAANLQPSKPKDFTAFVNLVEFCSELLMKEHVDFFEQWVYGLGHELILQSTRFPLVSGFYKLLSVSMKIAKRIKYFQGVSPRSCKTSPEDPDKYACFALFAKFGKEVSVRMKQYKDELLASCLTFVLSLPHDIVALDIKAYIPALQNSFKLGLSHTPLANTGLNALENWSQFIPKYLMQPHYKDILPYLDGFLKTTASNDEEQNNWEVMSLSRSTEKGYGRVLMRLLKKSKRFSLTEDSPTALVRRRVVRLLGHLGGQINRSLVTATSAEEMMKKFVAWDSEKRLNFAVPFADMKPVIYLDTFLPRITELALSTNDRQTKVAACELLHSVVVFMLGKGSQIPEGEKSTPPMYRLYKRIFPVLLRLACDVDQVTRQLFEPLVMQLIHWFTNNTKFESQDTVAMLEAILDGVVDPVDSTLRDFCGQCVQEFLMWSIKQTTPKQQEKSPANTKSLFKRLYSLALHPNVFKRLGAALAFNSIYRQFREESTLVDQFIFELLVIFVESLALAHTDEKSLGTLQQCSDAIDHLKRIIKQKAASLNAEKTSRRRVPRGFPPDKPVCLLDVIMWLLVQCGRPQTECRHKCMELFYEFVPLLPDNKSPASWLDDILKKQGVAFLIGRFESAGREDGGCSGILSQTTLHDLQEPFSLRAALQWMDMLLAALDCYNTFIRLRLVKPHEVLGTKVQSGFLKAIEFFITELAVQDISAAELCFSVGPKGALFSPKEREDYNYSKGTIIVRMMEFVSMVLENCQPDFWKLLEQNILNPTFFELITTTVCDPSSIGFNMADVEVMKNLPDICVRLLKALAKSPYKGQLEISMKKRISYKSVEELCGVDLCNVDARSDRARLVFVLSACKQLHKAGLLNSALQSQAASFGLSLVSKLLSVVYKGIAPGDERKSLPSMDVSSRKLADGLLQLAFSLGGQCEELVGLLLNSIMLSVPLSDTSHKNFITFSHGEYFYSLFQETINSELLKNLDTTVPQLMKSAAENPKMVSMVLNGILDQSFRERSVRKTQGSQLVGGVLASWTSLQSWWACSSSAESKMAALTLLSKVLQIDSSVSFNTSHLAFAVVFSTYTTLVTDSTLPLNLKSQALIILPFFTNLPGSTLADLHNALEVLVASHFPMQSDEFPKGTLRYNNYIDSIKKFLDALELSQSPMLLKLMTGILCRDNKHVMEELFQTCFKRIARRGSCEKQVSLLDTVYRMFQNDELHSNTARQAVLDRSLLTLALHCSSDALKEFFCTTVGDIMGTLQARFTKSSESTFETQLTKKNGCYKLLEVLYSRLPKEDVYSKESLINQAFCRPNKAEGNELSKSLLKSCFDTFTENMAGETQLLEKRRKYHCAAYNCAITVISCSFNETKFYQGFLFSEKPEKNQFIFENLIDAKHKYSFPVEIEVPLERKKKYVAIRKEARQGGEGDSDEPHYLSSQSYMADSSLSEEMSQFDFSTGIQSFSYSSQDPSARAARGRRRERVESLVQDDVVELEMDELNQHECMASMTALLNHMQRNNITPKVDEGTVPADLPPWMKFVHGKLGNASTHLNIKLFIAKLIINSEEVFRPYAGHWLGPLLQLVVSGNNGGEGIHYMVVEIVVTVLSWTSLASPKGNTRDEILANRLLEFLMKNAFYDKRAVFRHNLEIIKTVIECWKDCLAVPYSLIFDRFSGKDPNSKNNSVGIQLLGIVLANNLPPYDPKCGIDSEKYFQALATNISFTRFKDIYAAAAEVIGLVMQYLAKNEKQLEGPIFDFTVKELKHLQNTKEDKFVECLSKVVKNFPPLVDRFLNAVLFLLPKLHGVLKTHCMEILMSRAEEVTDIYLQLKSKDFAQIMSHRDEMRQRVCLDIVHKILAKLKPVELKELLISVTAFTTHPSPVCRERMYDILMWIHDNYRDPESQSDSVSTEVLNLAKETLLQGLTDENQGLQLYVRNFWSHESRLPTSTLERMLVILRSLYSSKIEAHYLSLATNLLLEMTSRSPDYTRDMFEYPLSDCKFQDYIIDSNWRHRSTVLTPMFVETQVTQGGTQYHTQDSAQGTIGGQVRATQAQLEFTQTQAAGRRSSFNWLTGGSIDTLSEYSLPSSADSVSSSLLVFGKRGDKSQQAARKPVGSDFGKKRLGLPGDEVDSRTKVKDQRADILRLKRRFLKDQEKVSLIYAKKGVREQKQAKENVAEQKLKREAQVTLYRSYRQGDLPDIQIQHSSLIAPLQALAQRDPTLAKQLFSSLFSGILIEMEKSKSQSEKKRITEEILEDMNNFLSKTTVYFPPFVTCVQDMSYRHKELLNIEPSSVSSSCLASLQQPMGTLLLEESLIKGLVPEEPPAKRARGRRELPPDTARWIHLAKLYRSLGDYDVLRGIFSGKIGAKSITSMALQAEAKSDYAEAVKLYNEALNTEEWTDGEPAEAEKDLWEIAALESYSHLTEWKSLQYCSTVNIDDSSPADLEKIWGDPFYQETYLPYVMRSSVKLLQLGEPDQSLLTFVDNAMKVEERKSIIETSYSQELSLLYILQGDFDRAKYYVNNCMQVFMQNYSSIDTLLPGSRLTKLQSVQALTEIQDFLNFMTKDVSQTSLKSLIRIWTDRYPDAKMDPMNVWDDIITTRCFFLDKIAGKLTNSEADNSMEVDGGEDTGVKMEVDEPEDVGSMIRGCKFSMKLMMADSARKQNNFSVTTKLLKELHRESKNQEDWLVRWVHSFSRFSHSRSHTQSSSEQILTVMKTIPLLEERKIDYTKATTRIVRDQNILLGTTYHIMANALTRDGSALEHIGADKAGKVLDLLGTTSDNLEQVVVGLHRKALQHLQNAVKKAEEELQSRSTEHVDIPGAIEAYMTLVNFCDKRLREEEESAKVSTFSELPTFPAVVVDTMLKALKLNSKEARLKFPRLLQIIELYPAETLDLMAKEVSSVPCWQLIGWISQMMALLDKEEAVAVQHVIKEIAEYYPQAILYPFMISSENYVFEDSATGHRNKEFVARLKSQLDKGGVVKNFIDALQQLTNPEMLFKDWVEDVKKELEKPKTDKKLLKNMYEEMYSALGNPRGQGIGSFRKKFAQHFSKEFDKTFGKGGAKLFDMKHDAFRKASDSLQESMKEQKKEKEPGNLKEYCPWMSNFKPEVLRNELEIPGQYDGKSKPLPEYHARITGFDERVKVMSSIRKPKRLIMRGNDEREYPFLVKGGEDLRQDQRIEQLFDVMNIILSRDATCSQRNLQLKTYQVIPMTTRIGLIEWLENTCTLKEFLFHRMTEEERKHSARPAESYMEWLSKMAGKEKGIAQYITMYKKAKRTETVGAFRNLEHHVPEDLLRRAFMKMSTTPEAFLSLRSHFTCSHALMCVSHWILGIGDRHLSNFMINMETGGMVGIDFGHAFGSATQFLPVPELMPFRLTRQFLNLMLPMRESGRIYSVMVHSLRAYRADPDLLINTMDVFVKEPSLDWKNFELKQMKKAGTWSEAVNTNEINWYPMQKVNFARRKLEGANPAVITSEELKLGFEKSPAYQSIIAVAQGEKEHNVRAREAPRGLSVETQVECLIDQATDPNILGRVYVGWEPWV